MHCTGNYQEHAFVQKCLLQAEHVRNVCRLPELAQVTLHQTPCDFSILGTLPAGDWYDVNDWLAFKEWISVWLLVSYFLLTLFL